MIHKLVYDPKPVAGVTPNAALAAYHADYKQSIEDPATFWDARAKELLSWTVPYTQVMGGGFADGDVHWFSGGKLNARYILPRILTPT